MVYADNVVGSLLVFGGPFSLASQCWTSLLSHQQSMRAPLLTPAPAFVVIGLLDDAHSDLGEMGFAFSQCLKMVNPPLPCPSIYWTSVFLL